MNSLKFLLPHVRPYRLNVAGFLFFSVFSTLFSVVSLAMIIPFLQILFGQVSPPDLLPVWQWESETILQTLYYYAGTWFGGQDKFSLLMGICVAVIVLFFLKNLSLYASMHVLSPLRTGVIYSLRRSLFERLTLLPLGYFSEQRKGDLMARISSDVLEVEWTIMNSLVSLFRDPLTLLTFLVVMFSFNFKLSLFTLLMLPLSALVIGRVGRTLRRNSIQGQGIMADMNVMVEETLGGMRIVKAFNAEDSQKRRFNEMNKTFLGLGTGIFRKRSLSSPLSEFLGSIVIAVVMWFGGRLVLSDSLEPSAFIAYIAMFSQIIPPAKSVSVTYYNLQKGKAALERIKEVLDTPNPIADPKNPAPAPRFSREIQIKNLSFDYGNGPVLNRINLTIKKGQTVALVGKSGAGKSTLMDLLPRFYDPTVGEIELDEVPIKQFRLKDLRTLFGMVPQHPVLFNDTVLANIAFGDPVPNLERAIEAAKNAHAHMFIRSLEKGYETRLGDAGLRLSGGQRQRIAIARALYKNPPVLLLDEATSALDNENESLVKQAIANVMKGRTVLVIAHRLSTVQHADVILVMENGEIVEQGTHESLLQQDGVYAKQYAAQFNLSSE
jgi:ATP-binding cassette, subfamily B, bacterial MsbA